MVSYHYKVLHHPFLVSLPYLCQWSLHQNLFNHPLGVLSPTVFLPETDIKEFLNTQRKTMVLNVKTEYYKNVSQK